MDNVPTPRRSRQELRLLLSRHGPTGPLELSGSHTAAYSPPDSLGRADPVWVCRAEGVWVQDLEGTRFLDFSCGGVMPLGYNHPDVMDTVGQFEVQAGLEWPERVELQRKLAEIVPGGMNRRVVLCDSGREAMARAVALACRQTGRKNVVYLTEVDSPQPELGLDAAAVVVHPLDERAGYAAELCRQSGALLIDDETFLAPGITGRMLGIEHAGIRPDMYVLGRGAAAGVPFGACVTGRSTLHWPKPGSGGSPAACLAALKYITLLEAGLLDAGRMLAGRLAGLLSEVAQQCHGCRVVGTGLVLGLRFDDPGRAARFVQQCRASGLILGRMGDCTVAVSAPLVAGPTELDFALAVITKVLANG